MACAVRGVGRALLATMVVAGIARGQCSWDLRAGPGTNGFNNEVWTMCHWDPDGAGPRQPLLIAGGIFTQAGGQTANRIAAYDGESWKPLGTGVNNSVRALVTFPATNELIVCGDFTTAGGVAASGIAKWNGSAWSNLGVGANNIVQGAAIMPGGDLFITGSFTSVSGVSTVRAARWNGAAWSAIAAGAPGSSLAVTAGGTVYAGGNFNSATNPNIWSWTGPGAGTWSGVGGGLGGCYGGEAVDEVGFLSNGDLVTVGSFATTRPACTAMRLVARWDGVAWSELYSSNLAASPHAMYIAPNDDIYIGTGWTNIWPGAGAAMFKWNTATSLWDNLNVYFDSGGSPYVWTFEPIPDGSGFYVGGRLQSFTLDLGAHWSAIGYIARYGAPTPIISAHPNDYPACPGTPVTLSVASGGPGTLTYQWRRNGVALSNDPGHISGATTPDLAITNLQPADLAVYTCAVTNSCGTTLSRDAEVSLSTCDCIDFNLDGLFPDTQDIADFVVVFGGGVCAGQSPADPPCNIDIDFNNDGLFPDVLDIQSLLSVFAGGPCL